MMLSLTPGLYYRLKKLKKVSVKYEMLEIRKGKKCQR